MPDCRRYFRPFFLDAKTSKPIPSKIYYDVFSYLTTQLAFSFTTAPFLLLTLPSSILVWARVYFYAVIGTALSTAFFASPAKAYLIKALDNRAGTSGGLKRIHSQEPLAGKEPVLGLPPDPQAEFEEAVQELNIEIEARQRRGIRAKSGDGANPSDQAD